MKVKVCGITNLEDAHMSVDAGADALGFIFVHSSPRYIEPARANEIIKTLPPFVTPVGVVADIEREEVNEILATSGVRCIQFHGNEDASDICGYRQPVIKVFRVKEEFDVRQLKNFPTRTFLLDTFVDGMKGGTGKTFDWLIAVEAKKYGRIILSGGLTPGNVAEAIAAVRPYAIDVNSGVEVSPGK
ncbi:MAG: phosphoribosylanthranilate isomerase, partial [bacterium]